MDATRTSTRISQDALLELGQALAPRAFDIRPAVPCFEIVVYANDGEVATRLHVTLERLNSRFQRAGVIERLLAALDGSTAGVEPARRPVADLAES